MHLIENDTLRVAVLSAYGARVVSLFDKRAGREWMTQGPPTEDAGEDAAYLSRQAIGWDECFPTVGAWDASATAWGRRLRDHGDLWGRPWRVDAADAAHVMTSYADPAFRFRRSLALEGEGIVARYRLDNLGEAPLPYLWALHALLAVEPGDRIEVPGLERVAVSYLALGGDRLDAPTLDWTRRSAVLPFALDTVQPRGTTFAGKFQASGLPGGTARIGRAGQWLEIEWDESIADLGIWLTYGGWPQAGGHQEIAVEPTSAPADHLGQAIVAGAAPLAPGARREWTVRLRVSR